MTTHADGRVKRSARTRRKHRRCGECLGVERFESRLAMAALFPLDQTFKLNSLPGADKTILLDFTGASVQGTAWNIIESDVDIRCSPFTLDASLDYSVAELEMIQQTWAHVAEDFRPFNVNVTTDERLAGSVSNLVFSGSTDTKWGIRVVISDSSVTNDENPSPPAQGVALLNSFKSSVDTPCFVDTDGLTQAVDVALVATHEIGHTLGLEHHGMGSNSGVPNPIDGKFDYYPGHTNGQISWGPIMGAPYGRRMTQWSKGEYASASRPFQDDLAMLSDLNGVGGFTYRADLHGDTIERATALTVPLGKTSLQGKGIIERNTDADMFKFTLAKTGQVTLKVRPLDTIDSTTFEGANLDVGATLYSADKRVVADLRPGDRIDAQLVRTLVGGTYFVKVFGTGNADPLASGYSNYASLGEYTVEVIQEPTLLPVVSVAAVSASVVEGTNKLTPTSFAVTLSRASASEVTVAYATSDRSATVAGGDYVAVQGSLTFAPGETRKTVVVTVNGDATYEPTENFVLEISAPANAVVGTGEAVVQISNDDAPTPTPPPGVSVTGPVSPVSEGPGAMAVFTIALTAPATKSTSVSYKTVPGTAIAGRDYTARVGSVVFAVGDQVKTVSVPIIDDQTGENAEQFYLDITSLAAKVAVGRATATIALSDGGARIPAAVQAAFASMAQASPPTAPMMRMSRTRTV